jgi:hypothetical protein
MSCRDLKGIKNRFRVDKRQTHQEIPMNSFKFEEIDKFVHLEANRHDLLEAFDLDSEHLDWRKIIWSFEISLISP